MTNFRLWVVLIASAFSTFVMSSTLPLNFAEFSSLEAAFLFQILAISMFAVLLIRHTYLPHFRVVGNDLETDFTTMHPELQSFMMALLVRKLGTCPHPSMKGRRCLTLTAEDYRTLANNFSLSVEVPVNRERIPQYTRFVLTEFPDQVSE